MTALPQFAQPPVVETVLGVEFAPLDGWQVPHVGLFWSELKSDYPATQMVPALPSVIEKFGAEARGAPKFELELIQDPPIRAWFINETDGRLLQIQRDRLIHNWRKTSGGHVYPRYAATREMFTNAWTRFLAFAKTQRLGKPDVLQCEVTYINHLERGSTWNEIEDIARITPFIAARGSTGFLSSPEAMLLSARYLLPDQRGRLHVSLQPAIRNADQKEIFQLQLTARGKPVSSSTEDILGWMDFGREWAVQAFTDVTTDEMHKTWGMR